MTIETKTAVGHLLGRIARDSKLAWYFDPFSRSMELLTRDYCEAEALDLERFRAEYYAILKFERPAEVANV